MFNNNKDSINMAVKEVYRLTNDCGLKKAFAMFEYIEPPHLGYIKTSEIRICRSIKHDDLTYKLYTKHDDKPLMTVYGCWPERFVIDVFIRALEHFYDDYSHEGEL